MTALVIDGHPHAESLTASLAQRYAAGHGDARVLALRDLDFDSHLRFGYHRRMTLEPDLVDAKQALADAQTIIVTTPLWWGSVPALLKGFFDRALLPQQEYRYTKQGLPVGLLPARHGRLLLLADTPWYAAPFTGLPAQRQVVRNTMKFCGVGSVRTHRMLGVKNADEAQIARWLDRAESLGTSDGRRDGATRQTSASAQTSATRQTIAADAASSSVVATS